jgi:F420-dependent oxidoreductase-like protein
MRVAVTVDGVTPADVTFVREAERLGADSVWVAEAWGYDAFTPLAYLAALTTRIRLATGIAQLGSRSPALLGMTALSMQALSGGRFLLGLGTSGPQVMEGWHGVPFTSPLGLTRDNVEIVRKVASGHRVEHDGAVVHLPLPGGEGRALRSAVPSAEVPIYLAALGPKNLELTGEVADGWLANAFVPEAAATFMDPLGVGAARVGRSVADLDVRHARGYAFTLGAMGSRGRNFYTAAFERQGYGEDVRAVQDLWLTGRREEAAARVPLDLGRRTNLLGSEEQVADRVARYAAVGVSTLQAKLAGGVEQRLRTLATLLAICERS